jgi:beta-phosphoglucomutase-like phosphatase (HAD superfamily)
MLSGLGLKDTFGAVAGRDHLNSPKPAPDVYMRVLAELGARPGDSIALEDSLTGVRAAQAAGIFVIAVRNRYTGNHDLSLADHIARDLFEVRDYLCSAA